MVILPSAQLKVLDTVLINIAFNYTVHTGGVVSVGGVVSEGSGVSVVSAPDCCAAPHQEPTSQLLDPPAPGPTGAGFTGAGLT